MPMIILINFLLLVIAIYLETPLIDIAYEGYKVLLLPVIRNIERGLLNLLIGSVVIKISTLT